MSDDHIDIDGIADENCVVNQIQQIEGIFNHQFISSLRIKG